MAANRNSNPEAIERDIERTQEAIGETINQIEEKLTPGEVSRSVLGDDGQQWVREGLRMARENPVPVGMIAIGAIWLLATSNSPLIKRISERLSRTVHGSDPKDRLRSRSKEPAPIGPPPAQGSDFDRRRSRPSSVRNRRSSQKENV
jgi:hypothetical protein